MERYVALLRGINVGGKNLIRMPDLATCFRDAGYGDVRTYIQSGNVVFTANRSGGRELEDAVEQAIEERFDIPILVVIRSRDDFAATIAAAPDSHGSDDLRSDVLFLKDPAGAEAAFAELPALREGVDAAALGPGAIYFSRVADQATKSRLNRIVGTPIYRQLTIRNWRTTTRLLQMLDED